MQDIQQLVKVRRIGRNAEPVLHAPAEASGYYSIRFDEQTGEIRYVPVKEERSC